MLNTVAIGAAYARNAYGRRGGPMGRVAIVDIDIHHGNGTEEIVRNLTPGQARVPLPASWAPQYVDSYKPWLDEDDAENVLFASVHLADSDGLFYPGDGIPGAPGSRPDPPNVVNVPIDVVGKGNPNIRHGTMSAGQWKTNMAKVSVLFLLRGRKARRTTRPKLLLLRLLWRPRSSPLTLPPSSSPGLERLPRARHDPPPAQAAGLRAGHPVPVDRLRRPRRRHVRQETAAGCCA